MAIILDGTLGITTPNENTPNNFAFKNLLINAGFTINQRAYVSAATLAATVYAHDRWKAGASGGDYSFTQLNSVTGVTIATGKTLIQVVENNNVNGTSYVLSWTGTSQARYAVNSATPAGSYAASPILITGQTAGITMSVEFNAGTLSKPQLELGTAVATSFDQRAYSQEFSLCQRYLPALVGYASGWWLSTSQVYSTVPFFVAARTAPTGITALGSVPSYQVRTMVGLPDGLIALTFVEANTSSGVVYAQVVGGGSTGAGTLLTTLGQTLLFTGCEL